MRKRDALSCHLARRTPRPSSARADLSSVAQDYLKVIWTAQEWSQEKVSTKLLAERMSVSASTVSEAVRKLADQGLVEHARYGSITLTEDGRRAAIAMVRRHRLIETFLVNELGYGWDEVHDEAEVLEHAVSETLMERIDAKLGHPDRDPHGDPIPSVDGAVPTPPARQLSDFSRRKRPRRKDFRLRSRHAALLRLRRHQPRLAATGADPAGVAGLISIAVEPADGAPTTVDLGSPAAQRSGWYRRHHRTMTSIGLLNR